jgi:mannose-6-phosphate isomerase-like protein (cupin superfamily)
MKINATDLPGEHTKAFEGVDHGAGISMYLVDQAPGGGPDLHTHPYEEVFVVHAGTGTWTCGDAEIQAGPGDVVRVPPETEHKFKNTGSERLRVTAIHPSPRFIQRDLE